MRKYARKKLGWSHPDSCDIAAVSVQRGERLRVCDAALRVLLHLHAVAESSEQLGAGLQSARLD